MKLVVFDCDGTLVDSQHMIVAAMEQAFAGAGLPRPCRQDVLSVVGLSLDDAVARLIPGTRPAEAVDISAAYKSAFQVLRRDKAHEEPLYPGIRETIGALAAEPDVLLGIATGKSRRGLAAVLEREGLADRFVTLQTADSNPSKPHPGMLHAAMAEAGTEPHCTLMVGDTTFDVLMACDAGVRAVGVAWGYHPVEHLIEAGAHCVVTDGHELPDLLKRELRKLDGKTT